MKFLVLTRLDVLFTNWNKERKSGCEIHSMDNTVQADELAKMFQLFETVDFYATGNANDVMRQAEVIAKALSHVQVDNNAMISIGLHHFSFAEIRVLVKAIQQLNDSVIDALTVSGLSERSMQTIFTLSPGKVRMLNVNTANVAGDTKSLNTLATVLTANRVSPFVAIRVSKDFSSAEVDAFYQNLKRKQLPSGLHKLIARHKYDESRRLERLLSADQKRETASRQIKHGLHKPVAERPAKRGRFADDIKIDSSSAPQAAAAAAPASSAMIVEETTTTQTTKITTTTTHRKFVSKWPLATTKFGLSSAAGEEKSAAAAAAQPQPSNRGVSGFAARAKAADFFNIPFEFSPKSAATKTSDKGKDANGDVDMNAEPPKKLNTV